MDSVAVTVWGLPIRWYGILISLGTLAGVLWMARRERALGLPADCAIDIALWVMPIAIVCARLYYVAFSWADFRDNPLRIFDIRSGGLAIYGGVLGGFATLYALSRRKDWPLPRVLDLVAPGLALGQAIGRWGNFYNQEAYGPVVMRESLQFFPLAVYIDAERQWHLATFFYESIWCLFIVVALGWAERRRCFRRAGDTARWYGLLYASERLIVEGLRMDSLYWGTLRVSQVLSLVVLWGVAIDFTRHTSRSARLYGRFAELAYVRLSLHGLGFYPLPFLGQLLWALLGLLACAVAYARMPSASVAAPDNARLQCDVRPQNHRINRL